MTLVVRQFVYQHVCISDRIQWLGPIILPMTVFVINSHGKWNGDRLLDYTDPI